MDADIVAALHENQFQKLQHELGGRFYVDADDFKHAVRNERSFNLIDSVELAKVDVFCVRDRDFQNSALERAQLKELERDDPFTHVRIASPEDLVLAKLRWYRIGGEVSDRQWGDLRGIVRVQGNALDLSYLRKWAPTLDVEAVLERLLAEPI
ncbi:MAG: hypothetical protein JNM17_13890 [Archangium sp.]|nr:hypothetical protein [Archangium sp.]